MSDDEQIQDESESDSTESSCEEWGDVSAWTESGCGEYLITEDPDWYHNFSWIRTGFDPKFDSEGKEVWGVAEIPLNQGWYSTKDCLPSLHFNTPNLSDDKASAEVLVKLVGEKISVAHLVLNKCGVSCLLHSFTAPICPRSPCEGYREYNWMRQFDALPNVTHWRFIGIMPIS